MLNSGFESTRKAIADDLNERYQTSFGYGNIIMTVGAGTLGLPREKSKTFCFPYFSASFLPSSNIALITICSRRAFNGAADSRQ